MGVWGWILLYVLAFSAIQLLVYRYLRNDGDAPLFAATPPNRESAGIEEVRNLGDRVDDDDEGGSDDGVRENSARDDASRVLCPRCGTENETGYTYCRNCVNPMAVR